MAKQINLVVPEELKKEVKLYAVKAGMTQNDVGVIALAKYIGYDLSQAPTPSPRPVEKAA